jgi:3-hydroxybutyryl-CoA dehydrogenase
VSHTRSEKVGVVGTGAIACGLAAVAAQHGPVAVLARSAESAARAEASIAKLAAKLSAAGNGAAPAPPLTVGTELSVLADAMFVVEAIVEDTDTKCSLLRRLGDAIAPDALLATTTSSLSIAALAQASGRPERFVGLHVFNPVHKMALVELVFPDSAGDDTRTRARALCAALGKTAVEVPDTPGFVVNRLLFPYLFDAVRLMEQTGLDPEAIDTCMKLGAGHPLGPLALLDLVGLDVSAAIGRTIGAEVPPTVERLIAEGALGRKAGRGFYAY